MTSDLKEKLLQRLKNEFEIYILIIVFSVWYLLNIGGAIRGDESVFALQGYYFMKGNMPAEQYRPMGRYFMGLGQLIFGRTTFGAKFFVFILSILTIYLTYKVARVLSNRIYGFFPALILGIIPLYGDQSVSCLLDIILTFFGTLLFFFALKCFKIQDIIKKQRLIFLIGALSICTLATKLYGAGFSLVVFLFLVHVEWKKIRTIKLLKRKNIVRRIKKNLFLVPVFVILGVLFGLLMRAQLSDLWESAGEEGRADVLKLLPGFLDNIVMDMNGSQAYGFFIAVGVVLFILLWIFCALVGREILRILKYLAKKKALDEKYHVLIYMTGSIIGFLIIYSPYIINPVAFFANSMLVQTTHLQQGSPKEIAGVLYDRPPWWSYLYWTYIHLGMMFVVGLVISLVYTGFRFIKKENIGREYKLLFLYTFVPLVLLSALSVKSPSYFLILFPMFSIFMVVNFTLIVKRIVKTSSSEFFRTNAKMFSVTMIIVLLLIPGPLWMTLDNPQLGHDSRYDKAAELVTEYVNSNINETVYIIAFDTYSIEFYLSEQTRTRTKILPLYPGNYSKDQLGRLNIYYPENVLYNMTINGTIDLVVDELRFEEDTDNDIRNYVRAFAIRVEIDNELVLYYL
jgi:4-amino-4-deoxy-L-arabinose transferase-like glycosyltransferase